MQTVKNTRAYKLIPIAIFLIITGIFLRSVNSFFFLGCMLAAITISGISIKTHWNYKMIISNEEKETTTGNSTVMIAVTSALYAVIGGFAIKTALGNTFDGIINQIQNHFPQHSPIEGASFAIIMDSLSKSQYEIWMGVVFLVTAIPFYHGAMIFLSDKSGIKRLTTPKEVLIHFIPLFGQSIIFLALSMSLQSFMFSVMMLILLAIVDSLWIIIGQKSEARPPIGWLCINIGFVSSLFLTIHQGWIPSSSSMYLGIICILRTAIDYMGFRDMYIRH